MFHATSDLPATMLDKLPEIPETDACVEWQGRRDRDGYGEAQVMAFRKHWHIGAHRLAYMVHRGAIPEGLVIDHLCRNRACVNPRHLEAVTNGENTRRGVLPNRTHCRRGHELNEANTRISRKGYRQCRRCSSAAAIAWKRAKRERDRAA